MFETGVANGHSTYFALNAISRVGVGNLYSVDVASDVGGLLRPPETENWRLHVMAGTSYKSDFAPFVQAPPSLSLFLHDSDHRYPWQAYESATVMPKMAPGAILLVDDADASFAFMDFCRAFSRKLAILVEPRKVLGVLRAS